MKYLNHALTLSVMLILYQNLWAQRTLIHCGTLIDGVTGPRQEVTITIEEKQITAVDDGFLKPSREDQIIDLKGKTVMPGFIDMHVHIEGEFAPGSWTRRFVDNPADVAFRASNYARRNLMAGFTTVRDLGGSGVNIALKNAINQGTVQGSRILTAGKTISITGGHGDPTNGFRRDMMGDPGPMDGVVNSPWDARKAVRQRMKDGADVIKVTATGGVVSLVRDGSRPQFTEEEMKAIVETANDFGVIVAAHAHGAEGIKRAIRAGVTTIEHGTYMDEEAFALMKEYGTYYIPTIIAGVTVEEYADMPGYLHPLVAEKARTIGPLIMGTFAKAYAAGVSIGFGTDAAIFPHGGNAREFELMVEAGMPPLEAIQAATSVNAKILQMEDQLGTIQTDRLADIVAVDGDPLQDISLLKNVTFVMKEGEVYKFVDQGIELR